ncbi:MAG: hypothetical protein OHK0046_03980 [Anaerolineae bacterium]
MNQDAVSTRLVYASHMITVVSVTLALAAHFLMSPWVTIAGLGIIPRRLQAVQDAQMLVLASAGLALLATVWGLARPAHKHEVRLLVLVAGLIGSLYFVLVLGVGSQSVALNLLNFVQPGFWIGLLSVVLLIGQAALPHTLYVKTFSRRVRMSSSSLNIRQSIGIALDALLANKFRSMLTMLGIIIGVMAVVSLMSIGQGAQDAVLEQVASAGTNVINVLDSNNVGTMTDADADALRAQVSGISYVVSQYTAGVQLRSEGEALQTRVVATEPDYVPSQSLEMEIGRFFDEGDVAQNARVIVLGSSAAQELFGSLNPVGRTVRVSNDRYEVIGVMGERSGTPLQDPNLNVYVPLSTAARELFDIRSGGQTELTSIIVTAVESDEVDAVKADVERVMREQHELGFFDDLDFRITDQQQLLSIASDVTSTMTVLLTAIAGVSLVVGGIGIMNISLVSVTERTREIGLRKAVGARRSHIMSQFLIETIVLSFTGGILGVIAGVSIALLVNLSGVLTASITIESIVLGLSFSVLVGIFFGVYPANRAAGLQPIEALRYE